MGVFAVIGFFILFGSLVARSGKGALVGAIVLGLGVAGDINGF